MKKKYFHLPRIPSNFTPVHFHQFVGLGAPCTGDYYALGFPVSLFFTLHGLWIQIMGVHVQTCPTKALESKEFPWSCRKRHGQSPE